MNLCSKALSFINNGATRRKLLKSFGESNFKASDVIYRFAPTPGGVKHSFKLNKYNITLLLFLKINDSVFQYIHL